jgi:D-alanine transaminase
MELVYFNGAYVPKENVSISPDDRGFLLADGVYEVVRWYGKSFFDIKGHFKRLRRSLEELQINWNDVDTFPSVCLELIKKNSFESVPAMVYLQVTRGAAKRTHTFPVPDVQPTVYAFAFTFSPDEKSAIEGVKVMLKEDIRWRRCDIKSIALLPNTLCFNEAYINGYTECIFNLNGSITEGTHSNIFFVRNNILFTHPESNNILSGITRNNVLRIAREAGLKVKEEAMKADNLKDLEEAFITNTSSEIVPVIEIGGIRTGDGKPGPVTRILQAKFKVETEFARRF